MLFRLECGDCDRRLVIYKNIGQISTNIDDSGIRIPIVGKGGYIYRKGEKPCAAGMELGV